MTDEADRAIQLMMMVSSNLGRMVVEIKKAGHGQIDFLAILTAAVEHATESYLKAKPADRALLEESILVAREANKVFIEEMKRIYDNSPDLRDSVADMMGNG